MKTFVVIDGYSTGSELVSKLRLAMPNNQVIHIITPDLINLSSQFKHNIPTHNPQYTYEYIYDCDYEKLVKFLSTWDIVGITCGTETEGVILRDQLAVYFELPHNNMDLLQCRRNKFAMGEQLKTQGLEHIQQFLIEKQQELLKFSKVIEKFPQILKPIDSGSSDGFIVCKNIKDLVLAFNNLHGKTNLFNKENSQVILQEYVYGKEYAINSIAYDKQRYITDVWSYEKFITENGLRVCLSCSLEQDYDPAIIDYTFKCLDAIGHDYGVAHTEVIQDKQRLVMLESASRLMGGINSEILEGCLEITTIDALVMLLTQPKLLQQTQFGVKKNLKLVNIVNNKKNGFLDKVSDIETFEQLPSYKGKQLLAQSGQTLQQKRRLNDCIARLFLAHEDAEQIKIDYEYIRRHQYDVFIIQEQN